MGCGVRRRGLGSGLLGHQLLLSMLLHDRLPAAETLETTARGLRPHQQHDARGGSARPVLTAAPAVITADGESLQLSWQASFAPRAGDAVLMSCGSRSHPLDCLGKGGNLTVPVNATARGVHTAMLINMRCNYTAAYVRAGEVLAELVVPLAAGLATAPAQGHIAFGDGEDQMHVLWVSASTAVPIVRYSTSPNSGGGGGARTATGSRRRRDCHFTDTPC